MKKLMTFGCALALAGATLAAANDALISFSTPGPDTYADGTPVLDKECYALVWTATGASFTLAADGTTEGGEIVLVAPVAKGGRCPKVIFEVDADDLSGKYKGGSWSVYLLDTRRYGESGVSLAPLKDGQPTVVNASSVVESSAVAVSSSAAPRALSAALATSAVDVSALPAGFDRQPKVSDISVRDGYVYVTVENTVPYLAYDLTEGETPDQVTARVNNPRNGDENGPVVLVTPAKPGGGFFKVGRK